MTRHITSSGPVAPMTDIKLHWLPRVAKFPLHREGQPQLKHADSKRAYQVHYYPATGDGGDKPSPGQFVIEAISSERGRQEFATIEQVLEFLLDELFDHGQEI